MDRVPGFSHTEIRPASPSDIPALAEMINSAFAVEEFFEGTRTDIRRLSEDMQHGTILMLESEPGHPQASLYFEERGDHAYVGMLAVSPVMQGKGLALRLIEAAEERFRAAGLRFMEISVLSLRPELLPLYRRYGFVEAGSEPFLFARTFRDPSAQRDCHCIVMRKSL